MKKAVILIMILGILTGILYYLKTPIQEKISLLSEKKLEIETEFANIEEISIYGRNLNLKGTINLNNSNPNKLRLLLYNNNTTYYDLNYKSENNTINFQISDKINNGILLDTINLGKYYLFIEASYSNQEENIKKYYPLKNITQYPETTYYTLSNTNQKITILSESSYPTMLLNVVKNEDKNIYDIVIDPGHGGLDSGATNGEYKESSLTYQLAILLKKELEQNGLSVKLTHNGNIPLDEVLDYYDNYGRAVIPQKVKAKYLFSLHLNSSSAKYVNGLEIYTANNIDYTFAQTLASNLIKNTKLEYSNNNSYKIDNGIYTHNFTEKEIQESTQEMNKKGRIPYTITTNSNYFYMIRETGGFMTGAYVDARNPTTIGINPYYNSNTGVESYILELGYITNTSDLTEFINNKEKYATTIANTINQYLTNKPS